MIKPWIQSARLRTIPLAISGILLGVAVAKLHGKSDWQVSVLAVITAILLQVLSNYANDYGDFLKGTDKAAGRNDRMLTTGSISEHTMKNALIVVAITSFLTGLSMLWISYSHGLINQENIFFFIGLGIAAIAAAITYTVGKRAYGYFGLGDFFVFVFFGIVPVIGITKLLGCSFGFEVGLAAAGMGFLSTAVLNTNNYRDIDTDRLSNKITLAVRMGVKWNLFYHRILLILGFSGVFLSFYHYLNQMFKLVESNSMLETVMIFGTFTPGAVLLASHYSVLIRIEPGNRELLNQQLKKLSLSILLTVIIYCIMVWYFTDIIKIPQA